MLDRISEIELVLPALYLMQCNGGSITTTQLIKKIRSIMNPDGEDLAILAGRQDDKFSQKVRNLKAHNTFEQLGYAKYDAQKEGKVSITPKGTKYLENNKEILSYLLTNDFQYSDIKKNLRDIEKNSERKKLTFDENIVIQEGIKKITQREIYERSTKLRNYAINFFTKNNRISCQCCLFDFEKFYGKKIGKGFIEIHHKKPVFQYKDTDIQKTLEQAIKNLTPICSNCHRMIHRNWAKPLEIKYLMNQIEFYGVFRD